MIRAKVVTRCIRHRSHVCDLVDIHCTACKWIVGSVYDASMAGLPMILCVFDPGLCQRNDASKAVASLRVQGGPVRQYPFNGRTYQVKQVEG